MTTATLTPRVAAWQRHAFRQANPGEPLPDELRPEGGLLRGLVFAGPLGFGLWWIGAGLFGWARSLPA